MNRIELEQLFERVLGEPEDSHDSSALAARAALGSALKRSLSDEANATDEVTTARLAAYLDGALEPQEAEALLAALLRDAGDVQQLEATRSFVEELAREKSVVPPELIASIVEDAERDLRKSAPLPRRRISHWGRNWGLAGGAIAAMVLAAIIDSKIGPMPVAPNVSDASPPATAQMTAPLVAQAEAPRAPAMSVPAQPERAPAPKVPAQQQVTQSAPPVTPPVTSAQSTTQPAATQPAVPQATPAQPAPTAGPGSGGIPEIHTGEQVLITGSLIRGAAAVGVPVTNSAPGAIPDQVLITGSLIRGTPAIGVPATNLSPQDFAQAGALTTSDLFRTVPQANSPQPPAPVAIAPPPPPPATPATPQAAPRLAARAMAAPAPYASLSVQPASRDKAALELAQSQLRQNTERYPNAVPNPVKSVAQEPVSTFSMDVDTASYSNVRRYLARGSLPPVDAVRVEEMINYFDYHYAVPRDRSVPFQPTVAVYPTPWNPDTQIVHIGIKGYDLARSERPRANLVFLIDSSGSMEAPNKLPLLKQSFRLLVDQLRPEDRVSIVTYAGQAGIVLEPTSGAEKGRIMEAIDRLSAGGSTAGGEGIRLAYRLAEENFDKEGVNRVILATDGDFNVGITDPNALADFVGSQRSSGVFLNTLGFGYGNYNDLTMQKLAQAGNGVAAYVDNLNEARKIFVDQIAGTLFTIAKDVKVQVEFNPARVAEYRLIGYETRLLQTNDFNNDKVDAGDIGAGHTVTALYEITPVGSKAQLADPLRYGTARPAAGFNDTNELAYLKIRYKLPSEDESKLMTRPITAADVQRDFAKMPADFRFAAAVAGTGQLLRRDTSMKDFDYRHALDLAEGAVGEDEFGYRREFVSLLSRLVGPVASLPVYGAPGVPVALTSHAVTPDDYPAVSVRLQEQGSVQVKYLVDMTGDVGDCLVTSSSGKPRLDEAACRMVKARWKFKPVVVNGGTAIPVWLDGQITFQLQ